MIFSLLTSRGIGKAMQQKHGVSKSPRTAYSTFRLLPHARRHAVILVRVTDSCCSLSDVQVLVAVASHVGCCILRLLRAHVRDGGVGVDKIIITLPGLAGALLTCRHAKPLPRSILNHLPRPFNIFFKMESKNARLGVRRGSTRKTEENAAVRGGRVELSFLRLSSYAFLLILVGSCSWVAGRRNASSTLSVFSCTSPRLERWKAEIFGRAMTLSKRSDFLARKQEEPEGHLRFSLFDSFDHCKIGNPSKVGGEGDGMVRRRAAWT